MTTKEIFASYKESLPMVDFKIVKGWVYRKNFGDKRFSCYQKEDLFVNDFIEMQNSINANKNCKITVEYMESIGLIPEYKSVYGAKYFFTSKGKIRISNHHWTSEKHNEPDLNLCSYEKNGHVSMINELEQFLN
jgi:hypothetical protein